MIITSLFITLSSIGTLVEFTKIILANWFYPKNINQSIGLKIAENIV